MPEERPTAAEISDFGDPDANDPAAAAATVADQDVSQDPTVVYADEEEA